MARSSLINIRKLIDTAKKSQAPEMEFVTDLKRSIEKDNSKGKRKPSQYYKPSSMKCIRNMYYTRIGNRAENDSSYMSWGICNSGIDTHGRVQKAISHMRKNGFDCDYVDVGDFVKSRNLDYLEITRKQGMETHLIHKVLNLSFLCDGIIKYKNHYYILELKTESSSKWYSREGVALEHHRQAIAYSVSLAIDEVLFVYINRDIFDMKPFMFNVTEDMKNDLVGLIEECDGYVKNMIAPPKPDNLERKTCEYCGYKSLCRKEF
jgi:CRISPR/Cas system-associated exonuclease Cas4 (RecB family)